ACRRAAGRRARQAQDAVAERARADDVGVLDQRRARDRDALHSLLDERLRRRLLVELPPDDVARREELTRPRHLRGGPRGRRLEVGAREDVGELREALVAQLKRVDEILVRRAERAGRTDLLRLRERLLLLLRVALQLLLELGLLRRGREQLLREVHADRVVGLRDRAHLVGIRGVLLRLALPLARADPEDEPDDDDDRDRDQAGEPCERHEAGRRAQGRARGPVAAAATAGPLEPREPAPLRRLDRLRLVEEVELEGLVVVLRHL